MDLEQIKQGQKDWVKTLNDDLSELSVKSETAGIVTRDGWSIDTSNPDVKTQVRKFYLLDGNNLIVCQLRLKKAGVTPNERGNLFSLPDGYNPSLNYLPSIPVDYGGHTGGYLELNVANGIGYRFVPLNGNLDGEANKAHDLGIETTLMWLTH